MSAPVAVNTADGTCWTRRGEKRDGEALYAPEGVCNCPPFVMATLAELAEHGIVGSADALPMPVREEPQEDPVAAGRRLDLLSLMDERAASVVSPVLAAVLDEAERLRARVAELEAGQESPLAFAEQLDAKSLDNFLIALAAATEYEPQDGAVAQIHELIASYREGGDV